MPIELKIMITWAVIFFSMIFMDIVAPDFYSKYVPIKDLYHKLLIVWVFTGLCTAVYLVWT